MRFSAVILIALLVSEPVLAQGPVAVDNNFARTTCSPAFSCGSTATGSISDLAAISNACIVTLGYRNPQGYFDTTAGLDANNCLTTRREALTTVNGVTMVPQCCVVQKNDQTCVMRCDLNKM